MSEDSLDEENFSGIDERQPCLSRVREGSCGPNLHIRAPALSPPHSHQPSPRKGSDAAQRLASSKQHSETRPELRRTGRDCEEMKQGAYAPEVRKRAQHRTLEEFLNSQRSFEGQRSRNLEQLRQRQQNEELQRKQAGSFEFSPGSRVILTERGSARSGHEQPSPQEKSAPQHRPFLTPKSKRLKREEKIEDILYKDAMRRMLKPGASPLPEPKVPVNPHSEELLAEAIFKEIEGTWIALHLKAKATYLDLGKILTEMKYLSVSERGLLECVWTTLKGKELGYVSKATLANFLCVLNNLKAPARSVDTEDTNESELTVIAVDNVKVLRKLFRPLIENKKRAHLRPKPARSDFPYKPQLSPGSRKISEKWLKPAEAPCDSFMARLKSKADADQTQQEITFKPIPLDAIKAKESAVRNPPQTRDFSRPEMQSEMIRIVPSSGTSMAEPQEAEEPIMLVNVTLPTAEVLQFELYRDDEVEERVREFVHDNALQSEEGSRIFEAVQQYLRNPDGYR